MIMALKLTPRLILLFALFALLLLGGLGGLVYASSRASLEDAVTADLYSIAFEKSTSLNRWFMHRRADITSVSRSPTVIASAERLYGADPHAADARAQLIGELQARVGAGTPFLRMLLLNPDTGRVSVSTDPRDEGQSHAQAAYFRNGRSATFVDSIQYSLEDQRTTVFASTPLRGGDDRLVGVIVGELILDDLAQIIWRYSGVRASEDAFLLNPSSYFVTQPMLLHDPAVLRQQIRSEASIRCLAGGSGTILANDYRGIPAIIRYEWLDDHQLCLIVKVDQRDIFAPSDALGWEVLGIGGLIMGFGMGAHCMTSRKRVRFGTYQISQYALW
jgi:hypothetical protein